MTGELASDFPNILTLWSKNEVGQLLSRNSHPAETPTTCSASLPWGLERSRPAGPYEKPISGFSSPVKVTTLAIGGSHSPQPEGLRGQDLCFLRWQGQVMWRFSYESAQAAPDVKAA